MCVIMAAMTTPAPSLPERRACTQLLNEHCQLLIAHVDSDHAHDELMRTAMWGPVQPTIDNPEHRNAEEGVSHRVGVLYAHSQNGGVPSKIRARDLAVITGGITLATKVLDLVATAVT